MALHPTVAAVRLGVRQVIGELTPGSTVLVACSGGADSLALLSAVVFEARAHAVRVVGVTVDHQLQDGSADHAARVVDQMRALGVDESVTATVSVTAEGVGPEAAARQARYDVLEELATRFDADQVLLGHTLDDQAETVLLGLARGSGGRSLAGMRRSFEVFRRPLLDVTRADTETACVTEGIEFWTDPHNSDEQFTRVRVRTTVLPMLEHELGPGIARTLARTADQLRADTSYLDAVADAALAEAVTDGGLAIERLSRMDVAVRGRVLRLAAVAAGSPPGELFHEHVVALDRLVMHWHGQKGVDLPGHVRALRAGDVLGFERGLNR